MKTQILLKNMGDLLFARNYIDLQMKADKSPEK